MNVYLTSVVGSGKIVRNYICAVILISIFCFKMKVFCNTIIEKVSSLEAFLDPINLLRLGALDVMRRQLEITAAIVLSWVLVSNKLRCAHEVGLALHQTRWTRAAKAFLLTDLFNAPSRSRPYRSNKRALRGGFSLIP